jgi:SAM-dependent methyltransferase
MPSQANAVTSFYQRHGAKWVRDRGDQLIEAAWLDRFRRLAPPGAPVLDLGCGSGRPLARTLMQNGHPVTGIDAASGMIDLCRQDFPGHEWHVADMRTLHLPRRFGLILAWDSFFHLAPGDQRRMFPIFRNHAAKNAALMFTSGCHYGEAIGTLYGNELYHASLDPAEYRTQLDNVGFKLIAHVEWDADCGNRNVWLAQAG